MNGIEPLLLLLPLLAALAALALAKPSRRLWIAAALASFASLIMLHFVAYSTYTLQWFSADSLDVQIVATVAPFNMALLAIVFFVGGLIYVYSAGYMDTLSEQKRFYIEMLAFQISMSAFAMAGNFILLFIAWEFLSMLSYLLIGFWHTREKAVRAARLAITTVLIGDVSLIAAIVILWNLFGTFTFASIISNMAALSGPAASQLKLYVASVLLIIAIFTKSAQFPFQEWLPEAMEGPTPVSAFLHSTTMVKAGVFASIILFPIFSAAKLLPVLLAVGLVTAVIATLNAIRETHVKRVIAYSTVQELSLMLVAVSAGALVAAVYFFIVQSFYKALLFFAAGDVMKATKKESITEIRGLKSNRLLYISTLFGVLSVAGLVPFSGFFASAGIDSSLSGNLPIYALISAISLGTSFFIFRWFIMISLPDKGDSKIIMYKGLPKSMVLPAAILAAFTIASSAIIFYLNSFLNPVGLQAAPYMLSSAPFLIKLPDLVLLTALFAIGAALAIALYSKGQSKSHTQSMLGYSHGLFIIFYDMLAKFVYEISEGIVAFDIYLSSAFDWIGHFFVLAGRGFRRASVGSINPYAFIFAVGLAAIFALALLVVR
ncbi:MAG: proton-conducting transporter membrane subunit [Candidatus Micrarchaeaceae archaeon]